MEKMKKALKILATIIVLTLVVLFSLSYSIFNGACQNQVFNAYYSPDKSMRAIVFQRDCGATTGFSTQISILNSDEELDNEGGNIFIIKGHPSDVAPEIVWTGNQSITIHHRINGNEFKAKNQFGWLNPVKVTYD